MIIILSHRCNLSCLVARCDVLIGGLLQAMWIKDYESSFDGGYFGLCTRCGEALLATTVEQLGGNVIPTIHCFIVETYCPNIPRHPSYFKHEKNERCRKKRYFKSSKVFSSPHFDSLGTKRKKKRSRKKTFHVSHGGRKSFPILCKLHKKFTTFISCITLCAPKRILQRRSWIKFFSSWRK